MINRMHYYQQSIGDYRRDTGHLSLIEHGIYRALLDSYYLLEGPLCADKAKLMRSHSVRTADEVQAFENVIADFFELTEDGYFHKRCDAEIKKFHAKSDKARQSASSRWVKTPKESKNNADAMRTHSEGNANHKPITNNQEPINNSCELLPPQAENKKPRATRLPNTWTLDDEFRSAALEINPQLDLQALSLMAAKFHDYWISKSGKDATKLDWLATWRNWVRNDTAGFRNARSPPAQQRFGAGTLGFTPEDYQRGINPDGSF